MFESLLDVLNKNIENQGFKKVQILDEFKEYQNKDSKYKINNWLFKSSKFRKWRVTKLDGGEKLQVFNTVAYPTFDNELPILGVDILWFGSTQKLLAVLDYQPLIQEDNYLKKYCQRLDAIKKNYLDFANTKMKNIYDSKKYFSPWVIICRGTEFNMRSDLSMLFSIFLQEYLNMNFLNTKNLFLNSKEIKEKHIEYDIYNSERDPAEKLFKTFFGQEWTDNFVRNYLFTLSNS